MSFFSKEPGRLVFTSFSPLHWTVIGVLALVIVVTMIFRARLRSNPRIRRYLPVWIGCVAWVLEIAYHVWTFSTHQDFIFNVVPLELCYIALLGTVVLAITRSHAVFEIYYFISVGALASVLFPAFGGYGPDHLRFWHYFMCHCYIIWLTAWYLGVEKYRLRRSAYLRLLVFLVPVAALARLVDWKFGVNYMFLAGPSSSSSPLDFLGGGVGYFVKLVIVALVIFALMYLVAPKEPRRSQRSDAKRHATRHDDWKTGASQGNAGSLADRPPTGSHNSGTPEVLAHDVG